jgi:hypothetical protein
MCYTCVYICMKYMCLCNTCVYMNEEFCCPTTLSGSYIVREITIIIINRIVSNYGVTTPNSVSAYIIVWTVNFFFFI